MPQPERKKLDIQNIRKAYGFTHIELALILGCGHKTIWKMIDNPNPPREVYQRVLEALQEGIDAGIDTLSAAHHAKRELERRGNSLKAQMWLLSGVLKALHNKQREQEAPEPAAPAEVDENPISVRDIATELVAKSVQ